MWSFQIRLDTNIIGVFEALIDSPLQLSSIKTQDWTWLKYRNKKMTQSSYKAALRSATEEEKEDHTIVFYLRNPILDLVATQEKEVKFSYIA